MAAHSPLLTEILTKLGDDWSKAQNRVRRHRKKHHVDDADVEKFDIAVNEGQKCIGASDPSSKTVGDLYNAIGMRAVEEVSQPTDGSEKVLMLRRSLVPSKLPRDAQKHLLGLTLDDAKVWMKEQADGWDKEDENRWEALHNHPFPWILERVTVQTGISDKELREASLKHFKGYSDLVEKLVCLDDKGQTRELLERLAKEYPSVLLQAGLMPEKPKVRTLASFSAERLRRLHQPFLDAAERFNDLHFVAVTVADQSYPLPEVPAKDGLSNFGLPDSDWKKVVQRDTAGRDKGHLFGEPQVWLQIEGELWEGRFFTDEPLWEDTRAQNKQLQEAIEEFDKLARVAAGHFDMPRSPSGGVGFPLDSKPNSRWLETVVSMPFVSTEDANRCGYMVREVPGNLFIASARTIETFGDVTKLPSSTTPLAKGTATPPGAATSKPNQKPSIPCNSAGEPFNPGIGTIWSVEDYYQAKELYEKHGAVFNPALTKGSPAANHVIAQAMMRAQKGNARTFLDVLAGDAVSPNGPEEFRKAYNELVIRCDEIGGPRKEALLKLRAQVYRYHNMDICDIGDLELPRFIELLTETEEKNEPANGLGHAESANGEVPGNEPPPAENVTERLPQTDAEADLLKPAIADLLRTIPEAWTEFDLDKLTAIQDNALFLLTAAGMIERRGWLRSMIANHPTCFEVCFQATGEGGFAKALEHITAVEFTTWGDAWQAWQIGETRDVSPFRTEAMKSQEWRLTTEGVIARNDLNETNGDKGSNEVFDFVLKRGFFGPGYWCRLSLSNPAKVAADKNLIEKQAALMGQDWQHLPRPWVSGSGSLLELRKTDKPASSQAVNLTNWGEGANTFATAFGQMLGPMFDAMSKRETGDTSSPVAKTANSEGAGSTSRQKLTVHAWSDLGIGIDANGKYLGVSPCPERYGVFPREKAVILDLPGKRWEIILDIFARSEHGNTAEKSEVMTRFGYIQSGEISPDDIPELAGDSRKMETLKRASKSLTSAIADLGRKLRTQVKGPTRNRATPVLSVASQGEVQAAFFVRHLVRGHDRKLRFGEEPVDRR